MQGYGNKEGREGENEEDSDANEDSIADDEDSDIKDGVFVFHHATTERSRLYYKTWDCVNIYLVANPVSYPYCIRLGFKLMCLVEKGQVTDWNKVKRNVRECAEMEGA
eukprot:8481815-Ditylum_brightwellii.AAC.1